jgi:hypothetical protein
MVFRYVSHKPSIIIFSGSFVNCVFDCDLLSAALSSYRSRMQVDYEFGMHVNEEPKNEPAPSLHNVAKQTAEPVKSPDHDASVWSKGASADLLF